MRWSSVALIASVLFTLHWIERRWNTIDGLVGITRTDSEHTNDSPASSLSWADEDEFDLDSGNAAAVVPVQLQPPSSGSSNSKSGGHHKASSHSRLATLSRIAQLISSIEANNGPAVATRQALERVRACMQQWGSCGPQDRTQKIIVVSGNWLLGPKMDGCVAGECIWAASMEDGLDELGYSIVYAETMKDVLAFHAALGHLITLFILQEDLFKTCLSDPFSGCFKSHTFPSGIPLAKTVMFWFWPGKHPGTYVDPGGVVEPPIHPLGPEWVISPEDYPNLPGLEWSKTRYIGYSIERACSRDPVVPREERLNTAFLFGKLDKFFHDIDWVWKFPYPNREQFFVNATSQITISPTASSSFSDDDASTSDTQSSSPVEFIAGVMDNDAEYILPGVKNLGLFKTREEFRRMLSRTRAVLGISWPETSPTPYVGLCMGVPFVHPILAWDREKPMDRSKWTMVQHPGLIALEEPYVYHFFKDDYESALNAIQKAVETPIDRYIPPHMTMRALKERLVALVEQDWYADAKKRIEELPGTEWAL